MGLRYTAVYAGTITNAGGDTDLFYIKPAADKPVKLLGIKLGQSSEAGDAAEEALRFSVVRLPATVTVGSGGAAVTPAPVEDINTVAFAGTVRANDTTIATTSGSATTKEEFAWNERSSPLEMWWEPDWAPRVRNAEAIVIRLQTTPADDFSIAATLYLEEG